MLLISPLRKAPLTFHIDTVCLRCLRKPSSSTPPIRRLTSSVQRQQDVQATVTSARGRFNASHSEYFWANGVLQGFFSSAGRGRWKSDSRKQSTVILVTGKHQIKEMDRANPSLQESTQRDEDLLPHRRRRKLKDKEEAEEQLPLDASNRLTTISSNLPINSLRRRLTTYLSLSKPRLSFLIVLTATAAYSLYPVPAMLQVSTTAAPSLSALTLLFLTTGTFLTCASANALNMLMEPEHDAKMSRTRNRPLVRKLISTRGALVFAIVTGITGTAALYAGVNPTTAFLAALNIALYAGAYTPLKRISVVNTWVGAIVGGIPPLMGWTAAAGQCATGAGDWQELMFGEGSAGGWLLAALLFCWQFPHFNALSWAIREEYKHAGYRMLCWVNPAQNGRVALRYSILMFPVCIGLAYIGTVEKAFVPVSLAANGWVLYQAVQFWRFEGRKGSARALFWASVWHLPIVLVVAMLLKKGLWERVWIAAVGGTPIEEEYWDEDEDEPDQPDLEPKSLR
jgi:protoheme IX farnesyltransferase